MRPKLSCGLLGAMCLLWAAPAAACDLFINSIYLRIPNRLTIGGGLQFQNGDPSVTIFSGDVAFRLGKRAVGRPAIGLCRSGADSPGQSDFSELVFGGALGVNVWNDPQGKVAINLQAGLAYTSFDGGNGMVVPLGAAAEFKASDKAFVFVGAALQVERVSFDAGTGGGSESESDTDPLAYAGITFKAERVDITAGLALRKGDSDTDTAFNVGFAVPVGTAASALRRIPGLRR